MKVSIVINADTRAGVRAPNTQFVNMGSGCRNIDFLIEGVNNKKKFFNGFDCETILHVDVHEGLNQEELGTLAGITDCLVLRKHTKAFGPIQQFPQFNDINYLSALAMARGDVVAHFDADTAAFARSPEPVHELIRLLDRFSYVSYPSRCSPNPVVDESFDHWWASTRFFLCKRETLDHSEFLKCLLDYDYIWQRYGDKKRKCHWLEHILGYTSNSSVFYPPMSPDFMVFCWDSYRSGVLGRLNASDYSGVEEYVARCGGIHYPCDVSAT